MYIFKKKITKIVFNKLSLGYSNKCNDSVVKPLFRNSFFSLVVTNKIVKFTTLLQNLFLLNKNVLFIDYDFNFNYLPIPNPSLFSRSSNMFNKYLKFFDIGVVIFLNIKKKKFIFKKLFSRKTINVSVGFNTFPNKFDLGLTLSENRTTHYILYLLVINTYLSVKNKNLNINGSTLFFF
jgi:hypothetical protein